MPLGEAGLSMPLPLPRARLRARVRTGGLWEGPLFGLQYQDFNETKRTGYHSSGFRFALGMWPKPSELNVCRKGRSQSLLPCALEKIPEDSAGSGACTEPGAQ